MSGNIDKKYTTHNEPKGRNFGKEIKHLLKCHNPARRKPTPDEIVEMRKKFLKSDTRIADDPELLKETK